jgi:uncharacterized protein YkwD
MNNLAKWIYDDGTVSEYSTASEIEESTVLGWMGSPGHKENILTKEFDKEGVGIAIADNGNVYITQNFC